MSVAWSSLPLLPLGCIMDHLSLEDGLAAMSTCRQWRNTLMIYKGRKETLKLRAKNLDTSAFLTRIFKKNVKNLHIYVNCSQAEFNRFMDNILPEFYDTVNLHELVIVGPAYLQQTHQKPIVKLKRILMESLVLKHMQSIQKLTLMGCAVDRVKSEDDRFIHKNIAYYSNPLTFNAMPSPADTLLSRNNISLMMYSNIRQIALDYELAKTESLVTLTHLSHFSELKLNICYRRNMTFEPIDWDRVNCCVDTPIEVGVNIVGLPVKKFEHVMENVLVENLALVSLKVLFCKTMYTPLVKHVAALHKATLRELVWADCPYESADHCHRVIRSAQNAEYNACSVNPFIFLCWQCQQLRRLVIHGYWIWHYDLVGIVRLRKSLRSLEVSAVYSRQGQYSCHAWDTGADLAYRVLATDAPRILSDELLRQVNSYCGLNWAPIGWGALPRGLRARPSPAHRAACARDELARDPPPR